jgi:hypothetical protein
VEAEAGGPQVLGLAWATQQDPASKKKKQTNKKQNKKENGLRHFELKLQGQSESLKPFLS